MVFSSFIFLFAFLPVFLACYQLAPRLLKNSVALFASYLFYFWGAPTLTPVLLLSSILDYYVVRRMERSTTKRGLFCALGVSINVGLLAYFKYANFFVAQLSALGTPIADWKEVVLPIGISFFTFQKISYIADVYRRTSKPAANLLDYLLYVALFPQLIAGPIIRYHDMASQLRTREHSGALFTYGATRFLLGLCKKVLLADAVGMSADNIFALDESELTFEYAWLGAVCYAYQIYFDFSAYSDMAIGLLAIMGFRIPENFCMPYRSASITEFWRRWHISLSLWMREYLYIPLGGNRRGSMRTMINLWIVFLLSGLWHGASWTFVVWGAVHGFFLSLERLLPKLVQWPKMPRVIGVAYTWLVLLLTWILFRAENFAQARLHLRALLPWTTEGTSVPALGMILHERGTLAFFICTAIILASLHSAVARTVETAYTPPLRYPLTMFFLFYALFVVAIITLATTAFNPFIYFRF